MAISTYDQLTAAQAGSMTRPIYKAAGTAEAAGQWYSYWLAAGRPGAGSAPSPGLNGEQVSSATAGTLSVTDAATGQNYLAGLALTATAVASLMLYDRLWQNSGITVTTTTAQTISAAVALPARDENGAALGENVEAWLEVYTATGNGSPVTGATISYTNSAGTAGRTGTIDSIAATAVAGTMVPISLQAGDTGVRSIQSITLGTSLVSGSVGLVLIRRLADLPIALANAGDSRNFFDIGRKLYSGAALCLAALCASTTAPQLLGQVSVVNG